MTSIEKPKMSKAEYDELRARKVEAAQSRLADAVAEIQSGQDWRAYLAMQSKLHSYSANNVVLLCVQHRAAFEEGRVSTPFPSYVAGFNTWRALGRTVERGQKGYTILAPLRVTVREARDADGTVRPLRGSEAAAAGETERKRSFMRGFSTTTVFAAEQTDGKELPVPPEPRLLAGEAPPGLGEAITQLIGSKGYEVAIVADKATLGGANGQTDFAAMTVQVRADMDDAAIVKTLLHEAAHVLLHEESTGRALPRSVQEVEAESVAFSSSSRTRMACRPTVTRSPTSRAGVASRRATSCSAPRRGSRVRRRNSSRRPRPYIWPVGMCLAMSRPSPATRPAAATSAERRRHRRRLSRSLPRWGCSHGEHWHQAGRLRHRRAVRRHVRPDRAVRPAVVCRGRLRCLVRSPGAARSPGRRVPGVRTCERSFSCLARSGRAGVRLLDGDGRYNGFSVHVGVLWVAALAARQHEKQERPNVRHEVARCEWTRRLEGRPMMLSAA
jgi:antirestriction protein ArdC